MKIDTARKLAALTMHYENFYSQFWDWFHSIKHLMTLSEAINLCECKTAMNDPLPWEKSLKGDTNAAVHLDG